MQPASRVELLNRLANEPDNLAMMGLSGIDLAGFFTRPGNIMLGDDKGVILFCHLHDGVYEGHYMMSSRTRGKRAMDQARIIFRQLFTLYEASAIVGHVPVENRASRVLTQALGFTRQGISVDFSGCPCVNFRLEKSEWDRLSGA